MGQLYLYMVAGGGHSWAGESSATPGMVGDTWDCTWDTRGDSCTWHR